MDIRTQRMLIWTGPAVVAAILIGMIPLAGFLPPPSPEDSSQEVADMFSDDKTKIRIGCLLMMIFFAMFATWGAAIAVWTRRMERGTPGLTYASLVCVGVATVMFEVIPMTWAVAAYRPDTIDPDVTRALNDWVWFAFLYSWPPFAVWLVLIGVAILRDHNVPELMPRWVGYMCFWVALLIAPAGLMSFAKDGPFAYDGVIALWIPFTVFFAWMVVMTGAVLNAIKLEERRQRTGAAVGTPPATNGSPVSGAGGLDADSVAKLELLSSEVAALKRQLEVAGGRER